MKNSDEKVNIKAFRDVRKQYLGRRDYSTIREWSPKNNHPTLYSKRWLLWHDLHPAPPPPVTNVNMLAALEKDYEEVGVDSVEAEGEEEGDEY